MKRSLAAVVLLGCSPGRTLPPTVGAPAAASPASICSEVWRWNDPDQVRGVVLTEAPFVVEQPSTTSRTGTHSISAPHLAGRAFRRGAELRAAAPGGSYVLFGPDAREHCEGEDGVDRCSSTIERPARLERVDASGKTMWSVPVAADDQEVGVVVADARGAFVTVFSPRAMCATVRAYASSDGTGLWESTVGCMTGAHSAYSNDVRVVLEPTRLLVWGAESMGLYVDALEPRTGTRICGRVFTTSDRE